MPVLSLTKHHGLGNDFLVLLDLDHASPIDAALARRLCDRHRGVGADGVIRVVRADDGTADVRMELRNADGGVAELSGNGLRCLGQAARDAGLCDRDLAVSTLAGVRRLAIEPTGPRSAWVGVEMGKAELGPDQAQDFPDRKARTVDMGNPHLVLLGPDDPGGIDVARLGSQIEGRFSGGMNVEFVRVGPEPDAVTLRVWERGVGETQACGTGACAAAAAAHSWGLVGERVVVHQPGGDAEVELRPDGVVLSGPTERIARIEVEL